MGHYSAIVFAKLCRMDRAGRGGEVPPPDQHGTPGQDVHREPHQRSRASVPGGEVGTSHRCIDRYTSGFFVGCLESGVCLSRACRNVGIYVLTVYVCECMCVC